MVQSEPIHGPFASNFLYYINGNFNKVLIRFGILIRFLFHINVHVQRLGAVDGLGAL